MINIVETISNAQPLKTFAQAIHKAGLAPILQGAGPLTVFVPADEAFAKLSAGTLDSFLRDIPKFAALLNHHIVAAKITVADLATLDSIAPLGGPVLTIGHDGNITINDAKVVQGDITCDNGILHLIDSVLILK